MEYSFDCLGHLTKMAATRIYSKTCFNDKPKLTLTYFNIIKDMGESRNFRQGGPGQSDKKKL